MKYLDIKDPIDMKVLDSLDIRVGTIKSVEDVEGSSKLLCLKVDFGNFERQILVGMKGERENENVSWDIDYDFNICSRCRYGCIF